MQRVVRLLHNICPLHIRRNSVRSCPKLLVVKWLGLSVRARVRVRARARAKDMDFIPSFFFFFSCFKKCGTSLSCPPVLA